MLVPLLGYFFCMITMLTAVTVLLTSFSGISTRLKQARHHPRPPVIGRTVTAEETAQWHSPVAKEASPAKDVSPVVSAATADTKQIKHYKPKVFARQRNNHGYRNALGYAEGSGYGPSSLFFR